MVVNGGAEFGWNFSNTLYPWYSMHYERYACWYPAGKSEEYNFFCGNTYPIKNVFDKARTGIYALRLNSYFSAFDLNSNSWGDSSIDGRKYLSNHLLAPLVQGKTYHFVMYLGGFPDTVVHYKSGLLSGNDIVANVGVYFSDTFYTDTSTYGRLNLTPQLNFKTQKFPDSGRFQWLALSGTYTAHGGEQYLIIGNFDFFKNFVYMYISPDSRKYGFTNPYNNNIFIDDVSLVEDTTRPMISLSHFSLGNDTTLCTGQKMRLQGDNPYFFHFWWNTGDTSQSIIIDTPGTYWCAVDYGCGNYTDTITVYPPLRAYRMEDTLRLCNRQLPYVYRLPSIPGNNHLAQHHWSDGSRGDTLLIKGAGIYAYYRSDACGPVSDTVRLVVEVPLGGTPAYLPDTTICLGDSLVLYGGSGYQTYRWSTGDTTQSILVRAAGTYSIMARTACDSFQATAHIQTLTPPPAFSLGGDTALCPDVVLLLQAPGGYTYTWAPIGGNKSYLSVRDTGYYTCTMSNRCGQSVAGIHIGRILPPEGDVGIHGDSSLCRNEVLVPATLYNHSAYQKWWSTGSEEDAITVTRPGLYTLALYNRCGIHKESLYLHGCKGILAFPNAFSPNGDGRNDVFRPLVQDGTFIAYYALKIFNRWGQQVFVSYHADYGWGAERCDVGTYFYSCRYKEWGKEEVVLTGEIELLK